MNRATRRRMAGFLRLGSISGVVNQPRPPVQSDFGGGGLQSPIYVNALTGECFIYVNGTITPINTTNVKAFGAKGDGTDDTAAFQAALNASVALLIPPGNYLVGPLTVPSTCHYIVGLGRYNTTIKFKHQAYSAGQILFNSSNIAGLFIGSLSFDCDDVSFKTAGTYCVVLNGSSSVILENVRVVGRGEAGVFCNPITNARVTDLLIDATGVGGSTFNAGFAAYAAQDVLVRGMRTTGVPTYSGLFGDASAYCTFLNCHSEGNTGAGFSYSMAGCLYSLIDGCTAINSDHEAFQFTNCSYSKIIDNTATWDNTHGVDFAISVVGNATGVSAQNVIANNVLVNSDKAGLVAGDNANDNLFEGNVLKDCGKRSASEILFSYTSLAGATNKNNTFKGNKINASGATDYGYAEFNNGAGATLTSSTLLDNEWQGTGTFNIGRYLFASVTTSYADDGLWRTYTPTLTSTGGAITAYTVNSASFRRRGKTGQVHFDITITNNGTGSGFITVTFPPELVAAARAGIINGFETAITSKSFSGIANGSGVVVAFYDGSYPGGLNNRLVGEGSFELV